MRVLPVELDPETVDALEIERELLGFENRAVYVRWLLEHRATIDASNETDRALLETYRERIVRLEERLSESRAADHATRVTVLTTGGEHEHEPEIQAETGVTTETGGDADTETGVEDEWTTPRSDPTVQIRGSPRRVVSRKANAADSPSESSSGSHGALERAHEVVDAMNLTPERVERIREDPIAEDAGSLGSVEVGRLDELSRRAVAKTRTRLGRDVQTGLEYSASTGLAANDVRPGEDVVDLAELSVPGRSADVVERRRELAGHAIAFLRDRDQSRARRSDFVDALYDAYPAGYETTDSWWRCVKTALKQVESIEGGEGSRVWQFRQ